MIAAQLLVNKDARKGYLGCRLRWTYRRVCFWFSWLGLAMARLLKDTKWVILGTFIMTHGLNHHSSVVVSAKLHIQRLSGMPRTMVASMCRCILSVIGLGDDTFPEWRPGGPLGLRIFLQKIEIF